MSAIVISFAKARECADKQKSGEKLSFDNLFNSASELRLDTPERKHGDISILNWAGLNDAFRKEIAEDVFSKKLFDRSVLISITFVSGLLTSYAKGEIPNIGITEYISKYEDEKDPKHLLKAANSAFIFFALMPESRPRSSLKYQTFGKQFGPSLYEQYGEVTKTNFGVQMAEAFEPLGEIVRERFCTK
jgi:hypothetical protein